MAQGFQAAAFGGGAHIGVIVFGLVDVWAGGEHLVAEAVAFAQQQ